MNNSSLVNESATTIEPKAGCVRAAADILCNKWTAQILKNLAECPGRFCSLEKAIDGINPRTLSQRLDQLESDGIITKQQSDSGRPSYALTDKGRGLIPVIRQMAAWGAKYC